MADPRPDTRYRNAPIETAQLQGVLALHSFGDAFHRLTLDTRLQYTQAEDIVNKAQNIVSDLQYIGANYQKGSSINLKEPTYIKQNVQSIYSQQRDLIPILDKKFTPEQISSFETGLAYLNRLSLGVLGYEPQIPNYTSNPRQQQLMENVRLKQGATPVLPITLQQFNKTLLAQEMRFNLYPKYVEKITQQLLNKPYFPKLILSYRYLALEKAYKYMPVAEAILNTISKTLDVQTKGLVQQSQSLFEWGDIFHNPVGTIVNIMGGLGFTDKGLTQYMTSYYSVASAMVEGAVNTGLQIGKAIKPSSRKVQGKTQDDLEQGVILGVTNIFAGLLKGLTNIITNMITSALTSFTSLLKSMMSLLKDIQGTSQVFKGIMEYLNLAINLFFLPFFTIFGEPILEKVMGFLTEMMLLGLDWSSFLDTGKLFTEDYNIKWQDMILSVEDLLENIMVSFIPEALSIVRPLLNLVEAFISTFLNNYETIFNMLKTGISVYSTLIEQNLISLIVEYGTVVFKWVQDNWILIRLVTVAIFSALRQGLDVMADTMEQVETVIILVLTQFGALAGALIAYRAMLIAQALTLGIQALGIPFQVLIGAGIGATVGAISGIAIVHYFMGPIAIDGLRDQLPEFANGGKIRKTRGGMYGIMSEALQGEFAIPESKLKLFRGNNNLIIRIKGKTYNQDQVEKVVRDLQNEIPITLIKD